MSSRYIDSVNFEKKALKSFKKFNPEEEEFEANNQIFPSQYMKKYPNLAQNWSTEDSNENSQDIQYDGGGKDRFRGRK
jgi:hypothetical protein